MSVDRLSECHHHVDEKDSIIDCHRVAYGRCPACQRKVCLEHLSEHHKIEIEPHFDDLIDRANQIRARLEILSVDETKQKAQQFVEAWKCQTIASIECAAQDKLVEIDNACDELTGEICQFKLSSLEKLKKDMLLSAPHIHRDYVHPDELYRLEQLLNMISSHIDRYSKHELLEDTTTLNTHTTTPQQQQQTLSSTVNYYHDQHFY